LEWRDTSNAVVVAEKHVGMPASSQVLEILENWLLPQNARAYMGGSTVTDRTILGLRSPTAIREGDRLVIEVDALDKGANVTASLSPVGVPKPCISRRARVPGSGQPLGIDLGTPTEGTWLLTVQPEDGRWLQVSDYVLVIAEG